VTSCSSKEQASLRPSGFNCSQNHAEISAKSDIVRIPAPTTLYFLTTLALHQEAIFVLVFASVQRMMTSSAITDNGSGSTNELEEETVSVAAPSGTAALSAGDTTAAARSISSQLTASEGPETTGTAGGASVTVLPPQPVHLIHPIHGLEVRQA
jgi:hypothetical protein